MILMMKKIIKLLILLIFIFSLNSCHSYKINTYPSPEGYKAQIEAHKNISKHNRELKKYHRQRKREIKKIQRKVK